MRRKAAGMMAVCLILAAIVWPAQVLAAQDEVVYYEDGSYAVVVMEEENTVTRATNRKTGSKAYIPATVTLSCDKNGNLS